MKNLYDVQQLLKRFGIYVYVGKRIWDIEVMAIELDHLYEARVISRPDFMAAKLVLKHEHQIEAVKEQQTTGGLEDGKGLNWN
ncbi:YqgQ family protein [Fructilactobacillus carniphilus]|uniref:YqgQ family protein n=1 Tax=Fructilactobacillus carniphilus TaxID=2940297 RepID=A0ABY5C231_9LACO|nr:YqgQ family protein [Fructilactobacillus carniphilus]USS91360.1 YqgQ family protein [Fructilactobacillus carniphilus]